MSSSGLVPAFVLHRRPFRDSSVILDVITSKVGKASVIARVSTKKTQMSALYQPFRPLLIEYKGSAGLKNMLRCEELAQPLSLSGNKLFSAFYINELTQRLWPQNLESASLYSTYKQILENLQHTDIIEPHLRVYELQLLELLGYGINFDVTFDLEQPIQHDLLYQFVPQQGFTLGSQLDRNGFMGVWLTKIAMFQFDSEEVLFSAKRLMRMAFKPYLGDKPLKSRELFVK